MYEKYQNETLCKANGVCDKINQMGKLEYFLLIDDILASFFLISRNSLIHLKNVKIFCTQI